MRKSKNYIKDVLNSALIAGRLNSSNKLIPILLKTHQNTVIFTNEESENIIQNLQNHLKNKSERKAKLQNKALIQSLGEYITLWQQEKQMENAKFISIFKFSQQELNTLKGNSISFLKIDPKKVVKMLKFLGLKFEDAKTLIEKTFFLANIEFSTKAALSRYDAKKDSNRGKSSKSAFEELMLKANKEKPFEDKENKDLERFIKELIENW